MVYIDFFAALRMTKKAVMKYLKPKNHQKSSKILRGHFTFIFILKQGKYYCLRPFFCCIKHIELTYKMVLFAFLKRI